MTLQFTLVPLGVSSVAVAFAGFFHIYFEHFDVKNQNWRYQRKVITTDHSPLYAFTATGNNNRLLQTAYVQMRRLIEPSHLDIRCLTFSLSTLYINVFPNDSLLKYKSRRPQTTKVV